MAQPGVGDEFAGYAIESELARGGMGVVFRARDIDLDRIVALKLIRPDLSEDDAYRHRFRAESRTAAQIEHPNVVSIYEAREREGTLYLVMQFIHGHDLRSEIVERGRLAPERAVALVEGAAAGLDAVHAAGLVHRDVKPANILIDDRADEPHALVTDFGVARAAAATTSMTETGQFVGTLDYVAPEQLQGLPVDARTDVYALGCLLYETVSGQVPFPVAEGPAKMYGHVHGEVAPIEPSLGDAAVALTPIVQRALAKSPDDRFPSTGDLGRAARAALAGSEPVAAERAVGVGEAALVPRSDAGVPTLIGGRAPTPPPPPPPQTERRAQPDRSSRETTEHRQPSDDRHANRARVLGGVVVGLIAAGLVAAAILLAAGSGSDGGDEETTIAQQEQRTRTVTETAESPKPKKPAGNSEPTTTEAPPEPSSGVDAAVAAVAGEGYSVANPGDYNPANTLGALVGSGSGGELVFFFVDGEYIGTDVLEPSGDAEIISSSDTTTEVSYGIYTAGDPDCCPSGGRQTVTYSWSGSELQPLDPIPPSDPSAPGSRR